jgi:hypothetical protein
VPGKPPSPTLHPSPTSGQKHPGTAPGAPGHRPPGHHRRSARCLPHYLDDPAEQDRTPATPTTEDPLHVRRLPCQYQRPPAPGQGRLAVAPGDRSTEPVPATHAPGTKPHGPPKRLLSLIGGQPPRKATRTSQFAMCIAFASGSLAQWAVLSRVNKQFRACSSMGPAHRHLRLELGRTGTPFLGSPKHPHDQQHDRPQTKDACGFPNSTT